MATTAIVSSSAAAANSAAKRTVAIKQQINQLEKREWKLQTGIYFWQHGKGRWVIRPRYEKCWDDVPSAAWERLCYKGRRALDRNIRQLPLVRARIERLELLIQPVGTLSHWLCIYSKEHGSGGWATNTGNGFYGGLQMNMTFQRDHGRDLLRRKGTANNWSPREQVVVAERAKRGIRTSLKGSSVVFWKDSPRGYHPWPNTARMCGLL